MPGHSRSMEPVVRCGGCTFVEKACVAVQVARIERAGGSIRGGRLVSDLQTDPLTGNVTAVVSRDREGHNTVHPADALVFAIGITGGLLQSS